MFSTLSVIQLLCLCVHLSAGVRKKLHGKIVTNIGGGMEHVPRMNQTFLLNFLKKYYIDLGRKLHSPNALVVCQLFFFSREKDFFFED